MTTFLRLLTVLLFVSNLIQAQSSGYGNATLKGAVTTSDGKPAAGVTIRLEHTRWGTTTNEAGAFLLRNIKPGSYTVKASAVGAKTQEQTITLTAGQEADISFSLNENADQLQEVVVSTRNLNKENRVVAKMPLKNLENPQVYSTVSAELMKQQGITNYDDALRNVPGISRTWESTGRAGDGAAYFALRGFEAQPLLTNGLPGVVSGNLDPANIEEIEVIKGPSGTLFGGGFYAYGGFINTITKKPHFKTSGEVAYNFGSFGLNRLTADFNTPLSKTEKIALRVNTAYHSEGSFQDAGSKKSFFVAPSLVYEVNDRLTFHFMAEILEEERVVAPVFFHSDRTSALDFKTIEELNLNPRLSFTNNDLSIRNPRFNMQSQIIYKLSDQWTSQTVVSRGSVRSNGIYTYIWDDVAGDNWFSQYFHKEQQTMNTTDIQQNFNGEFKIGKLRNRLLIGLDYFNRRIVDNGSGWGWARNVTPQGDVNYKDPFTGEEMPPVHLNAGAIDNLLAGTESANSNISNYSYSAYASDVLNITPALSAMVSLRADYFDSKGDRNTKDDDYDQFALSPKFGLVYQPILDKVSVFANYMNAFINVAPQQVSDADGSNTRVKSFKPEHADQKEFGVKTNLFSGKLNATASYYDIKLSDRVMPDATNPNNVTQGGKVRSRGFELDVNANPAPGFNLIAGYAYNRTKIVEGAKDDFYGQPGRAPGGQGPQHLGNFWATYQIRGTKPGNFGLGLGGNYASKYRVIDNDATGTFDLPSYTLINGSVFYNSPAVRVSLNVNNIGNEQYYIGYWSVNPQRPRNFVVSVAYKF